MLGLVVRAGGPRRSHSVSPQVVSAPAPASPAPASPRPCVRVRRVVAATSSRPPRALIESRAARRAAAADVVVSVAKLELSSRSEPPMPHVRYWWARPATADRLGASSAASDAFWKPPDSVATWHRPGARTVSSSSQGLLDFASARQSSSRPVRRAPPTREQYRRLR